MLKIGTVVGICTDRDEDQRKSLDSIARFSLPSTRLIALFNGVSPFPVDARYEVVHVPDRIGREQGVWRFMFDRACEQGWDWAATFHDDMQLLEGGWEAWIEQAARTHRLAAAAWYCWGMARGVPSGDGGNDYSIVTGSPGDGTKPAPGFLGVALDGCGMAFNMAAFRPRGCFTTLEAQSGWGEAEAGFWALREGWGCASIPLDAAHHPGQSTNTRSALNVPIEGLSETVAAYLDILPAEVLDADRIRLGERVIDVRIRP